MPTPLIAPTSRETLLSYGLGVHPEPLQAGQRVTLVLSVSNASRDTIVCQSIALAFPEGTKATDLIAGGAAIDTRQESRAPWKAAQGGRNRLGDDRRAGRHFHVSGNIHGRGARTPAKGGMS
jgi:hypothetical protein